MSRFVAGVCSVVLVLAWAARAHAAEDELSLDLGGTSLVLRRVPKGTFGQGSAPGEIGHEKDELVRTVTISRPFWLGKIPVTRGQFARFVAETKYVTEAERGGGGHGFDAKVGALVRRKDFNWRNPGFTQRDEDPVVLVSFADANAFTEWASQKTGRRIRLPTEAEWEYAARAGTTTPWYGATKESEALSLGWFKNNSGGSTHPAGTKKPNAWGFFDMAGNVFEWCRDVYAPFPFGDAVDPERTEGADSERRVLRGGSWLRGPKRGRSSARHKAAPGARSAEYGFRVAAYDDTSAPAGAAPAGAASSTDPAAPASSVDARSTPLPEPETSPSAEAKAPARPGGEGSPWTMIVAPLVSAGAAVGWVLARRGRRRSDVGEPPEQGLPPPASSARPVVAEEPPSAGPSSRRMPPRPALVDARESESAFRAPTIEPEAFVQDASTDSPAADSAALPSPTALSGAMQAALGADRDPSAAKPSEPQPSAPASSSREPLDPKPSEATASAPKPLEARTSERHALEPTETKAGEAHDPKPDGPKDDARAAPPPPRSSAKMSAQRAAELKAFEAWISAERASERRLAGRPKEDGGGSEDP